MHCIFCRELLSRLKFDAGDGEKTEFKMPFLYSVIYIIGRLLHWKSYFCNIFPLHKLNSFLVIYYLLYAISIRMLNLFYIKNTNIKGNLYMLKWVKDSDYTDIIFNAIKYLLYHSAILMCCYKTWTKLQFVISAQSAQMDCCVGNSIMSYSDLWWLLIIPNRPLHNTWLFSFLYT